MESLGRQAKFPRRRRRSRERDMWLARLVWVLDDAVLTKTEKCDTLDKSSSVSALNEDEDTDAR